MRRGEERVLTIQNVKYMYKTGYWIGCEIMLKEKQIAVTCTDYGHAT
jgi:hypothetical protein